MSMRDGVSGDSHTGRTLTVARLDAVAPDTSDLVYGENTARRLIHISKVVSGIACGCRCPACDQALIARKGAVNRHHFAHATSGTGTPPCAGAWETALHKLAKQIALEGNAIMLPDVTVEAVGLSEQFSSSYLFSYTSAAIEQDMDGLRPDAVLSGSGRDLLVEFKVAHAVGAEKRAELRRRKLPCIEIDLSSLDRNGNEDDHRTAILLTAPRRWLHHDRIAVALSAHKAISEKRRLRSLEIAASQIAQCWLRPSTQDDSTVLKQARAAGLEVFAATGPIQGNACFTTTPKTWQSAALAFLYLTDRSDITVHAILKDLQNEGHLKTPFQLRRDWHDELVGVVRAKVPDFQPPTLAINELLRREVARGALSTHNGETFTPDPWHTAFHRKAANETAKRMKRLRETHSVAEGVLALADVHSFDVHAWMRRTLESDPWQAPAKIAQESNERGEFGRFIRGLTGLSTLLGPFTDPPVDTPTFGLPVEETLARRRIHAEARRSERAAEQAAQAKRDIITRANAKAQADERDRLQAIADAVRAAQIRWRETIKAAQSKLGADVYQDWLDKMVPRIAGVVLGTARDSISADAAAALLEAIDLEAAQRAEREAVRVAFNMEWNGEQDRLAKILQAEIRATTVPMTEEQRTRNAAAARADGVRREAARRFGDKQHTDLWLKGHHPTLKGAPCDVYQTEAGANACMLLLAAVRRSSKRQR